MWGRKDAKEQPNTEYGVWNEMLAKKMSSMYRKYKRFLGKYQAYKQGPKDALDPKWTDNLMEDLIKYKGDRRQIKKFVYFDYAELNVESLQLVRFFNQFDGKNPLCPEQTGVPMAEHSSLDVINQEQNLVFKKFHEIPCNDRLKILYFFCMIRALYKEKETGVAATPQTGSSTGNPAAAVKPTKRTVPIGRDRNGNEYFHFEEQKDGRIYKLEAKSRRHTTLNFAECITPVANVRKLADGLSAENNEEEGLRKALADRLPVLEADEQATAAKEQARVRKLQTLNRSKKMISNTQKQYADAYKTDVPLVNLISNTIMTRAQLQNLKNRLTKPLTAEDIMREKYERQKVERQRRLERRQKVPRIDP